MNVLNTNLVALELRTLAAMTGGVKLGQLALLAGGSPTGRSRVYDHFICPGIKRDDLHAPNTSTMRILKERPAGKVGAFTMDFETPFIHRVRTGLQ